MRDCFLLPFVILIGLGSSRGAEEDYDPFAFLSNYCWDCHDELIEKGDRELVSLELNPGADIIMAERWEEVMHQLQLGEMPPVDEEQPTDAERRDLIQWVEKTVAKTRNLTKSQGGRVTHRRLNRHEYLYTLRDVFGLHEGRFDPTQEFPSDEAVEGFENNGAALRTSDQLLQSLFRSADETIAHLYEIAGVGENGGELDLEVTLENSGFANSKGFNIRGRQLPEGPVIAISEGMRSHSSTYDAKLFFAPILAKGVPQSGWYTIAAEVQAANRKHKYGDKLVWSVVDELYGYGARFFDTESPIELGIGSQSKLGPQERRKTPPQYHDRIALPDDTFTTVERTIWLDAGASPYLTFHNGPPKGVKMQFVTNELWSFDKTVPRIHPKVRANLTERSKRNQLYWDHYEGPEIRVRWMSLKGPLPQEKRHASTRFLFQKISPEATHPDLATVEAEIVRMARRLYRAPVDRSDMKPFFAVAKRALEENVTWAEALRPILKAMLCSPRFLFLSEEEGVDDKSGLSDHELRNRISYFLTAGPPDAALRECDISSLANREEQVKRLLASAKAGRSLSLFANQWLGLNRLGTMPPGAAEFPEYYIDHLEPAMKAETQKFILSLFQENRPVTDLVAGEHTWVNAELARFYGLKTTSGAEHAKVTLPPERRRGLLGQASIHTLTANGVETSPVIRGVWLLDTLFGTPPQPPPPDVPPLEPDIRGATTIREQLAKHANVRACNDCHQKIDPLGFAMEHFDPIGRYRDQYPGGQDIDSEGQYRGHPVASVDDIRDFLVEHPELLAHNVAHRYLTFALGRSLEFQDGGHLNQLIHEWAEVGYGLGDLAHLVVESDPFQSP